MRKNLIISVFFAGLASLAIEMAASRLLGNVFGTSNLVWASIIGLILIYLTVGYFLGGSWADRSPHYKTFYQILLWAGFSSALVPWISRPVLRIAADAFDVLNLGILFGSFTAVLVLLIVPMTLLGMASPFAIRLAMEDSNQAGKTAGRIYAISTLGSFFGTFLPVLVLIPLMGTYRTFFTIGLLLVVLGLWGLAASTSWKEAVHYAWMPILIVAMLIWGLPGTDKKSSGMVYESESAYNYIQVLEFDGFRYLRLNEGQGVHSIYHPDTVIYGGPWEQVLTAPFFNPAPRDPAEITSMAIVGLAAGTTARQASAAFPNIAIDGFEIDPEIVDVGRQWFDMNEPNLNVMVEDGRWGLKKSDKRYQIISVDAYRPPYIPAQMTTREFFQEAHAHLTDDGVLVLNVGRAPNDRRLIDALGTTLLTVFPTVHAVDVPDSFNTILFATMQPTVQENLLVNLENVKSQPDAAPVLLDALQTAAASLVEGPRAGLVFTDDHAPVEWITNDMVLRFLLFGEMEELS